MWVRTLTILGLLSLTVAAGASDDSLILGVLEDVPGVYVGEPHIRAVRVVFRKTASGWEVFPGTDCPNQDCLKTADSKYPTQVDWTIAFDGRNLGQVRSTSKEFKFYSHVGLQQIEGGTPVPTIGERSSAYGGYTEASVFRPLIAVSQPHFKDPEVWKPAGLPPDLVGLLRQQFRRKFPKLCMTNKQDETKLQAFPYHNEEVKLVKAYASKTGWTIAQLHLDGAIDCQDVEAGFEIDDSWFAVDPGKSVQYIGAGMWLVDAGDYDNDGKSELVFSINRENRGGYELFYDDFKKHTVFEFSYH